MFLNGVIKHFRVFKQALQRQLNEVRGPTRNHLELEFLPAYLEVLERPPSRVGRFLGVAIMLLCCGALLWSIYGKLDVISSAPGRIVVGHYSKTVQAAEAGVVTKIAAWNGQTVRAGDVLIELNPTSAEADTKRLQWQSDVTALSVARLEALLQSDPMASFMVPNGVDEELVQQAKAYLQGEWLAFVTSREALKSQLDQNATEQATSKTLIEQTHVLLATVEARYESIVPLAQKGNFSKVELLRSKQEVLEHKQNLTEQKARLDVLIQQEATLKADLQKQAAQWRQNTLNRLEENRARWVDLRQELVKAEETAKLQTVLAPVDGVVQQLEVHTIGAVVSPGTALMMIVPDTRNLEAEVNILNKDVGFIRAGQKVEVKVESFPYTKYGTVRGEVLHVSRDSIEDEQLGLIYPARVSLDTLEFMTEGETAELSAGMLITAEIKTGNRRVIDYLLSPLQEYQSEALRER
ncbi:HlyD family type I secretion periplasmic adaptor subunit [Marinibactrum halimedae]|uniref:Membrane fusion protein (MFP) family protein n=1 Tax=Marinibactrum halimedae TaxID=1444977 RepID=A0AA37TA76_9GAMM|nr:HlyD family type I secretion periplasmic adaptor subunit [Marinibactrum halimedae]MCD9458836.1 HlyD family type I secretion periplasmic adaptor subunit [Marinibactrum halimedae]GLS27688.1 HlyD family type I secretion periplasmic adaptor subunit [Marinibactrum halimedae]